MDYIKLITEEIKSHINRIVEQNEQVYKDHDNSYDYKVVNGEWQASKKGQNKFFSLKKYPKAIAILDKKYPEARKQSDTKTTKPEGTDKSKETPSKSNESPKKVLDCVPFNIKDAEMGNMFRGMVNEKFPKHAQRIKLDPTGSFNNSYIKKAWNAPVKYKGKEMCAGKYFEILLSNGYKGPKNNVVLSPKIDTEKVAKDTIKVNSISSSKRVDYIMKNSEEECATFANMFSSGRKTVGNAWLSHDIDAAGKRVFSVYTKINDNQIEKYKDLYKRAMSGVNVTDEIKSFNEELIGGKKPSGLQLDDLVGIYNPDSPNHLKAFKAAGKKYFFDGDPNRPGNTLTKKKIGFSFNTHVGIVAAMKDGEPIVFHNVHGNVISEPAKNLQITWVKRA